MESNKVGMKITTKLLNEKYLTNLKGLMLSLASTPSGMYTTPTFLLYSTLPSRYFLPIPFST
jgi:hypothetical protein